MFEKIKLDHKIYFQNTFFNVVIDSTGPSIILSSKGSG